MNCPLQGGVRMGRNVTQKRLGSLENPRYYVYMDTENSSKTAVVVADNQETILRTVSAALERAGFTVFATSSGSEALQYTRESTHPIELAVIDSEAVGINAAQLAAQLDAASPFLRTLFLTSEKDEQSFRSARRLNRNFAVLKKPFRRSQLLGHVLEFMDQPKVLTA